MKIIFRKLNAALVLMLLCFSSCSETAAQTSKHYKHLSEIMSDLKASIGAKTNLDKSVADKTPQPLNFIQLGVTSKTGSEIKAKTSTKSNTSVGTESTVLLSTAKKSTKPVKYKFKKQKNTLLKGKKLKFTYKKCSVKTGLIHFITGRPLAPTNTITTMKVYMMITTERLVLTKDEKKSNLIKSIPLVNVQRIDQHYLNTNCFDVILNEIVGKNFRTGQLSLCAKNRKEMDDWVNTILEFKKCSVKGIRSVDHNGKIILDLDKINKYTDKAHKSKNYELSKLYYNAKDTAIKANKHKKKLIKKALKHIVHVSEKGEIASNQLNRQYRGRMLKTRDFNKDMEQKQFNLRMAFARKILREKELEASMNSRRVTRKQLKMLKDTAKKINEIKHEELTEYTTLYEDQIKRQKEHNIRQAKTFMNLVNQQDKLTDYRQCYQSQLEQFKNRVLVRGLCKQYYGKFAGHFCERKESFCTMCCDFHIGLNFPKKRFECKRKCQKVIKRKRHHRKGKKDKKNKKNRRKNRNNNSRKAKKGKQAKRQRKQNKQQSKAKSPKL